MLNCVPCSSLLQFVPVNWQSLNEADAVQLQYLIIDSADVFAMDRLELGKTELVQHVIDMGSHTSLSNLLGGYHFYCI